MAIKIRPIKPSDIPAAVSCIQRAFDADPYNNWVFDKKAGRFNVARNYYSLKAKCEWGMRNALFYVAVDEGGGATAADGDGSGKGRVVGEEGDEGELVGVSMWMKPQNTSTPQTWASWLDDYLLWFKQGLNLLWYRGRGGLRTERYWIWKREQAIAQAELWTDPQGYYFCNIVVVSPDCQGKGVGKLLFEVVTSRADREGRRSYLESSRDEPNVRIYQKMGFEVRKKMVCVAEDGSGERCDLFCMIREPKTTT